MKHYIIYFRLIVLIVLLYSCKKEDLFLYDQTPRLNFYNSYAKYTFCDTHYVYQHAFDSLELDIALQGNVPTTPKKFCLTSISHNDERNLVEFSDSYIYAGSVHKYANRNLMTIKVRVNKPDYPTGTGSVLDTVIFDVNNPKYEFEQGCENLEQCIVEVKYSIKPLDWNNTWWGKYSNRKYMFMMDTFQTTHSNIGRNLINLNRIRDAYEEYRTANGPLLDDEGEEIVFPTK